MGEKGAEVLPSFLFFPPFFAFCLPLFSAARVCVPLEEDLQVSPPSLWPERGEQQRGEESHARHEAEQNGDEDEGTKLGKEGDLGEEEEEGGTQGGDGPGEDRHTHLRHHIFHSPRPGRVGGAHVSLGKVRDVVHAQAGHHYEVDALQYAQLPPLQHSEAEHARDDGGDAKGGKQADDDVACRDGEHDERDRERYGNTCEGLRYHRLAHPVVVEGGTLDEAGEGGVDRPAHARRHRVGIPLLPPSAQLDALCVVHLKVGHQLPRDESEPHRDDPVHPLTSNEAPPLCVHIGNAQPVVQHGVKRGGVRVEASDGVEVATRVEGGVFIDVVRQGLRPALDRVVGRAADLQVFILLFQRGANLKQAGKAAGEVELAVEVYGAVVGRVGDARARPVEGVGRVDAKGELHRDGVLAGASRKVVDESWAILLQVGTGLE
mmetsp:Transcript_35647/g.92928  ORF Transcript_35647/g.92928 Transcript_35647/m.92928 type:complete len:433 (+) Transcript_35647:280-1578(+)